MQGGGVVSLFPFTNTNVQTPIVTEIPPAIEYDWNFSTNEFNLQDGKFIILTGIEALEIWVKKCLSTQRLRYLAYSWDYGHELEKLIGGYRVTQDIVSSEARRYIWEALKVNQNIKSIISFTAAISDMILSMEFTLQTTYGEVTISV